MPFFSFRNEEWDLNWCDLAWMKDNSDHLYREGHNKINHFQNQYEVRLHQLFGALKPSIYSNLRQRYPTSIAAMSQKPHGEKPQKTSEKPGEELRALGGLQM